MLRKFLEWRGKRMKLRGDDKLNPQLKKEVQSLRQAFKNTAEEQPIAERFDVAQSVDRPGMWVTDKATGKEVFVPLFAYGTVRRILSALFE